MAFTENWLRPGPYSGWRPDMPLDPREPAQSWLEGGGSMPGQNMEITGWLAQMDPTREYWIRRGGEGGMLSDPAYQAMLRAQPGIGRDVIGEAAQRRQELFEGGGARPARALGGGLYGGLETWGAQSGMGRSGAFSDALRQLGTEFGREQESGSQAQAARLANLQYLQGMFGGGAAGAGGAGSASMYGGGGSAPWYGGSIGGRQDRWGTHQQLMGLPPGVPIPGADFSGMTNPYSRFSAMFPWMQPVQPARAA